MKLKGLINCLDGQRIFVKFGFENFYDYSIKKNNCFQIPIRLSFSPSDDSLHSAVLLIRNNLTVVDAVIVQGRGGRGYLKFGSRKPGSSSPLIFNIGPKHLKDCDSKFQKEFWINMLKSYF